MRVAVVLGTLNAMAAWKLTALKVDCIYHFSANELSLPKFPISILRLLAPQLDALQEAAIVERCIDRNIGCVVTSVDDATLMRRALRLSELRVEARCYLNAVKFIQQQLKSAACPIESVLFVSHYLGSADIPYFSSDINLQWHHVPHARFLGMTPGLSRLVYLFQLITARRVGWLGGR